MRVVFRHPESQRVPRTGSHGRGHCRCFGLHGDKGAPGGGGGAVALLVFAMHVFVGEGWGGNEGVWSRTVCVSLTVSQGNYTPATIVCEDALRGDHLIADMADNKTKILQCWKLAVDEHLLFAKPHGFTEAVKLLVAVIQRRVVNKT